MTRRDHRIYEVYELILSERPDKVFSFEEREKAIQYCLDKRIETGKMYRVRIREETILSDTSNSDIPLMEI